MSDAPKLKDYFTPELVDTVGDRFAGVHPDFDTSFFTERVFSNNGLPFAELTFTGRARRIADALHDTLDLDVPASLDVLIAVLPEELDDSEGVLNDGFWMWPLGTFIATYAIDHFEPAMDACYELTKRFTSEFAIRPFLERYPETLDRMGVWAVDPNEHVRRLVSEGTRSRLPWATRISIPVDRVLELLFVLRADESIYVRRSVANHLNDLAKDDSDRIVEVLERWHAEGVEETTWIVRRGLRNHMKAGDPRVLRLFGYAEPEVGLTNLAVTPDRATIGDDVQISFDLTNTADYAQRLMIDLVVGYVKANGAISPKIFKFRDITLSPSARSLFEKTLEMVERSTRVLHPGVHTVALRINGVDSPTVSFDLRPRESTRPLDR